MPPEIDANADLDAKGADKSGDAAGTNKSSKDDWIPKSQFLAALQSANAKSEELQARNARLEAAAAEKVTAPKPPTRAELLTLVEAGTITQAVADAEWERQIIAKATKDVDKRVGAVSVKSRIEAELAEYKALAGDAWIPGTPEREKVAKAYQRLVARGLPETASTELTALENVFGEIDAFRESKKARTGPAEQHSETGGGRAASGGGNDGKDPIKSLTDRQRDHYQRAIKAGAYKDWAAVGKELARARARQAA